MVGGGSFDTSTSSFRQVQDRQYRQAQNKFFFSLTIAAILYKYMHIYLCSALRIVVFERWICGFWMRDLWWRLKGAGRQDRLRLGGDSSI